jgi:hypothetical protein
MDISMALPTLTILPDAFTIHRLPASSPVPEVVFRSSFMVIVRTSEELSLVIPESIGIESEQSSGSWACIKVNGPLDLNQVGILSGISTALAEAKVNLFVISTYDTDFILVNIEQLEKAKSALEEKGYLFLR